MSLFPDAKVLSETRWGEGGPMPKGSLMAARFQLKDPVRARRVGAAMMQMGKLDLARLKQAHEGR